MSKLTPEIIAAIEPEAEEKFPTVAEHDEYTLRYNGYKKERQKGYIYAATAYAEKLEEEKERSKKLVEALESISQSPYPANERELFSWIETARDTAINSLTQYKQQ